MANIWVVAEARRLWPSPAGRPGSYGVQMLPDWGLCQDFGPLPAPYRQHRREPICHSPQFGNAQSSPALPGPHSRNALLVPLTPYPRTAPPGEKKSKISLATRRGICILFSCANAPHQFPGGAVVAQLTVNQRVVGSNPTRGARNFRGRRITSGLFSSRAALGDSMASEPL